MLFAWNCIQAISAVSPNMNATRRLKLPAVITFPTALVCKCSGRSSQGRMSGFFVEEVFFYVHALILSDFRR